jgi:hypothetical protein
MTTEAAALPKLTNADLPMSLGSASKPGIQENTVDSVDKTRPCGIEIFYLLSL